MNKDARLGMTSGYMCIAYIYVMYKTEEIKAGEGEAKQSKAMRDDNKVR